MSRYHGHRCARDDDLLLLLHPGSLCSAKSRFQLRNKLLLGNDNPNIILSTFLTIQEYLLRNVVCIHTRSPAICPPRYRQWDRYRPEQNHGYHVSCCCYLCGCGSSCNFNSRADMLISLQTSTPVPIYICAALYIVMAMVAAVFPFEPYGSRSS